jgi:hypothetical protein
MANDTNLIAKALSNADLLAMVAKLQADLATAKASKQRALSLKVSTKGAVSLYGMGKFPVTLYAGQWDRVLNAADEIREFMDANKALLATKD